MRVQSLRREDPLEEEIATHSSIPCLENSIDRGIWQATVLSAAKSRTRLTMHAYMHTPFHTQIWGSASLYHSWGSLEIPSEVTYHSSLFHG